MSSSLCLCWDCIHRYAHEGQCPQCRDRGHFYSLDNRNDFAEYHAPSPPPDTSVADAINRLASVIANQDMPTPAPQPSPYYPPAPKIEPKKRGFLDA